MREEAFGRLCYFFQRILIAIPERKLLLLLTAQRGDKIQKSAAWENLGTIAMGRIIR